MPLLFCYGSNNPAQLAERIGAPRSTFPAYAPGHQRVFRGWSMNWGGGVASLDPIKRTFITAGRGRSGSAARGLARYERVETTKGRPCYGYVADVTPAQLSQMDLYEGVAAGKYKRARIDVSVIKDGKVLRQKAVAYIATSKEFAPPSKPYLVAVFRTISSFWQIDSVRDITIE